MDERDERDGRRPQTRGDDETSPGDRAEPRIRQAAPSLIQLGRAGRPPGILVAAFVLFVAIAILKPWPDTARPSGPVAPRPAIGAEPTPQPTADPLAELRSHCEQPLGWRVYSIERWTDQTLRIWRSFEPAPAVVDAADPRIPALPLGPAVELAGYCSPWDGPERPPAGTRLLAWSIQAGAGTGRATPVELDVVAPHPQNVLGGLFGPPAPGIPPSMRPGPASGSGSPARAPAGNGARPSGSAVVGPAIWPRGRFVFELVAPGWQRWWAVDVPAPVTPGG
jgi:hypothetical protein